MKRSRTSLIGASVASMAAFALGVTAPNATAAPKPAVISGAVGGHAKVNRQAILNYWTPARMAAAKDVSVITAKAPVRQAAIGHGTVPGGGSGRVAGHLPSGAAAPAAGTATPNIANAFSYPFPYDSWNVPKADYTKYPYSVNGKIFFVNDGGNYVCSGTVIPSAAGGSNENQVWTAGHCLANTESLDGHADTSLEFVPGWYKAKTNTEPYGVFTWTGAWETTTAWLDNRDLSEDEATFTVGTSSTTGAILGNATGWDGFAWGQSTDEQFVAFGYPQASPYNGNNQVTDLGASAVSDTGIGGANSVPPIGIGNPMTGGSSGGAWDIDWTNTGPGYVDGHNDYKYNSQPLAMYSPYQDTLSNTVRCFGASSC